MKKLLSMTAILVLLLVAAWIGVTWFVGLQTEKQVRRYLDNTNGQHTLIDYQRSLLSSQVVTQLNVIETPLGQWVDDLPLVHDIRHGPVIWQSQPRLSLSHWQTRLDEEVLDEPVRQLVNTAFASQPPFQANINVDFDQSATYQFNAAPLQIDSPEDGVSFAVDGLQLNGKVGHFSVDSSPTEQLSGFEMTTGSLQLGNDEITLSLPALVMIKSAAGDADEVTVAAQGASVLFPGEVVPVVFNLAGRTATIVNDKDLQGDINLRLDQFSGLTYPLSQLDFKLDFSGINQAALMEINRLQNRMQDIQAQLSWDEGEVELPDERRQMTQLTIKLRGLADQLLAVLFNQALQADKSQLNYELKMSTANGEAAHTARLKYAGTHEPVLLEDLVESGVQQIIPLIRGDIDLNIAKAVLPPELGGLLFYPLQQKGLIESGDQYRMDLRLLKNDMELNGRVIEYGELLAKFMPPYSLPDTSNSIPDEVWDRVEKEGLSDELLNQLRQRDDISAETMELLEQLQETSKILQE